MSVPFRWNLKRREQLGTWLDQADSVPALKDSTLNTLRAAAAKVIATSEGAHLGFLGRTPENFFDYLSGIFDGIPSAPRLHMIQFSMRWLPDGADSFPKHQLQLLADYFRAEGVHPADLASAGGPLAIVDFVASGGTYENLCRILMRMAREDGTDWQAVQRHLMLIGLVPRKKNSPNTWRWQQNQEWLQIVPDAVIRNVSLDAEFIYELANVQEKTTPSFTHSRWSETDGRAFDVSRENLIALAGAVQLYDRGKSRKERMALAGHIAESERMSVPRVRELVTVLRGSGG